MSDALRNKFGKIDTRITTINPEVINTSNYDPLRPNIDDIVSKRNNDKNKVYFNI